MRVSGSFVHPPAHVASSGCHGNRVYTYSCSRRGKKLRWKREWDAERCVRGRGRLRWCQGRRKEKGLKKMVEIWKKMRTGLRGIWEKNVRDDKRIQKMLEWERNWYLFTSCNSSTFFPSWDFSLLNEISLQNPSNKFIICNSALSTQQLNPFAWQMIFFFKAQQSYNLIFCPVSFLSAANISRI